MPLSKKYYVQIAKVLCEAHQTQPECDQTIDYMMANLAEMFKKDNPKFDKNLFARASRCAVSRPRGEVIRQGDEGYGRRLKMFGAGEGFVPAGTVITSRRRRRR